MTCIVGIVHHGKVYLGADSALTSETCQVSISEEPKVFAIGEFVFGCSGSSRVSQLLHYAFTPPPIEGDLMRYMVVDFVKALKACLKDDGQKDDNLLDGSGLLVGVRGRLFCVYADFQMEETPSGCNAIGGASDIAMGALYATRDDYEPHERLCIALEAAQEYNVTVRPPFVYVQTEA
jgi:hypothetical protein